MNTDLHKRFEDAAKEYVDENYKVDYSAGTTPYIVGLDEGAHDGAKEGFLAGAELGYKEAIKVAKKWLSKQTSWDYYDDKPCKLMTDDRLADFETDMNKLLKEKK